MQSARKPDSSYEWKDSSDRTEQQVRSEASLSTEETLSSERLFVYQGAMRLVAEDPNSLRDPIKKTAESYNGYIELLTDEEIVLRVQAERLEEAMSEIGKLGKVKSQSISGEDVTLSYQDHEIRLDNAKKYRLRYLALLEKANNVEEILRIEKELERVNTEIDQLSAYLKLLSTQINLASLRVILQEKVKPGPLGYLFVGLYESVKWIFVRN